MLKHVLTATLMALTCCYSAQAENWPAWRGANGKGISNEAQLPLRWSADKNVKWKLPLPERCNSTPIVWDGHVFLTQGLNNGQRRAIVAVDRKTGKQLWQRVVPCGVAETTHRQNPACSSSPVTDGRYVYAHFASAGTVAYDFSGKLIWHRQLGKVLHRWGNGGSPILYKDLLIVVQGPGKPTYLTALNKRTGKTVWKVSEPGINSPIFGSWSTPVVLRVNKIDELILPLPGDRIGGPGWFKAYHPKSGKAIWQCTGLGNEIYAMPIVGDNNQFVVGVSGHNGPTMAVRTGGRGDVTKSHRIWQTKKKTPQRIGSGVIIDGLLYLSNANGTIECIDAEQGQPIWKKRLGGNLWGSILATKQRLYVTNLKGVTFVLKTGRSFHVLAKNQIGEETYAALAASNGQLFQRTYKHLYCIEPAGQ